MDVQQFQATAPIGATILCVVALLTLLGAYRSFRQARRDPTWRYRRDARERGGRLAILGMFMLFMGLLVYGSVGVMGWVIERGATPTPVAFIDPLTVTDLPTAFPIPPTETDADPAFSTPTTANPTAEATSAQERTADPDVAVTITAGTPSGPSSTPLLGPTITARASLTPTTDANALATTIAALPTRTPIQLPTNAATSSMAAPTAASTTVSIIGPAAAPTLPVAIEPTKNRVVTAVSYTFTPQSTGRSNTTAIWTATPTLSPTKTRPAPTDGVIVTPTLAPTRSPTNTLTNNPRVPTVLQSSVTPPADATITITALDRDLSTTYGPVNPATVFPAGLTRVYFFVNYKNMLTGMVWRGALLRNGAVINRFERFWGSSIAGSGYFFFATEDGFEAGDYEIRVYFGLNPDPVSSIKFKMVPIN